MELTKKVIGAIALTAAMTAAICYVPLIGGCSTTKPLIDPTPKLEVVRRDVTQVAEGLPQRAERIDDNAGTIQKAVPVKLIPTLVPNFAAIGVQTQGLRDDAGKLSQAVADLQVARGQVEALKAAQVKLDASVAKLEAEKRDAMKKLMGSLIVLSVIGLGIAGVLMTTNTKLGLSLGVGCLVTLVAAVVVASYSVWLALGGAVVVLVGLIYVWRKLVVEQKATVELVETVETVKQALSPTAKRKLFEQPTVAAVQSDATMALVRQAKKSRRKAA